MLHHFLRASEQEHESRFGLNPVPGEEINLTTEPDCIIVSPEVIEDWSINRAYLDKDSFLFNIRPTAACSTCGRGPLLSRRVKLKVPASSRGGIMLLAAKAAQNRRPPISPRVYMRHAITDWTKPPSELSELLGIFEMLLLSAAYGGVHLAA